MDISKLQHKIVVPTKEIDPAKLQGPAKKSRFQLAKEAAELRAKQDEQDAAKAYEEFVEAFEGGPEDSVAPGRRPLPGFVRAGTSTTYNPLAARPGPSQPKPLPPRAPRAAFEREESPPLVNPKSKKRKMDSFLDELKRDQADRESRLGFKAGTSNTSVSALAAAETGGDYNDPNTTNVHVYPLPANVSEQDLGQLFARYGAVGTIKIMWPRDEALQTLGVKRTTQAGLGGFVAMMDRKGAEKAYKDLDGYDWQGCTLRTTWGKAVPLPYRPLMETTVASSSRRSRSPSPRGRQTDFGSKRYRRDYSPSRSRSRSPAPGPRDWPELESRSQERFLEEISDKVKARGPKYEQVLRDKETRNPDYAFLYDQNLPSYHYFRMLQDCHYKWERPIHFEEEGTDIIESSATESEGEEGKPKAKAKATKGPFKKSARAKMEALLRTLSTKRCDIGRAMAHAVENAEWSDEISDMVVMSIMAPTASHQSKIARFYLLSDILANSSNALPSAWRYRSTFEEKLLPVFDHLNEVYQSFPGRMKADAFKRQILNVLGHWEALLVFTPSVLDEYMRRLSGAGRDDDIEGVPLDEPEVPEAVPKPARAAFRSIKVPRPQGEGQPAQLYDEVDGVALE